MSTPTRRSVTHSVLSRVAGASKFVDRSPHLVEAKEACRATRLKTRIVQSAIDEICPVNQPVDNAIEGVCIMKGLVNFVQFMQMKINRSLAVVVIASPQFRQAQPGRHDDCAI